MSKWEKGCKSPRPDGGWPIKREKKKAKEEAEAKAQAEREKQTVGELLRKEMSKPRKVKSGNEIVEMTPLEIMVKRMVEDALIDQKARTEVLAQRAKAGLDKSNKQRSFVLAVRQPMLPPDEWDRQTEGQLLTIDPLEGIPGYDPNVALNKPKRGHTPD